jgi:general L-amino acid transport system permease protein
MSEYDTKTAAGEEPIVEDSPAIPDIHGVGETLRKGLFKDVKNTVLTLVFGFVIAYAVYKAWFFITENPKVTPDGEVVNSWRVIRLNLQAFMVGSQWGSTGTSFAMLWAGIYTAVFALAFAVGPRSDADVVPMSNRTRVAIIGPAVLGALVLLNYTETITPKLLTAVIPVVFLAGFRLVRVLPDAVANRRGPILIGLALLTFLLETGFDPSNLNRFGGLLLTINVAFVSIVACFPIGVLMALGRRSSFPLIRPITVGYIELIRGVPLISLLFMGQFALPFFLPPGSQINPTTASIVMITLFSAAYVAEIVRGGLQSVPNGQTEAGQAVGLSPVTITRKIVLPQALRNSIPALVGQFIALLKDTTLLIIIGQFDILGVSKPILAGPQFQNQGYAPEVYAFVAFMFWVICFSMSRASQRLETKLGVGTR